MKTRVKICCIGSREEADLAIRSGADALGLVSRMPSGPGPIPEELIRDIAGTVPPGVDTFLLTSLTDTGAIIAQHKRCRTSVIQLVDRLTAGTHAGLREALPGIRIVQVIHVRGEESVQEALAVAPDVDALLLDSGRPDIAVPELGGTGRVHDWSVSRIIRERCGKPVFLAGGLNPANAGEAIRTVRPFGVDVCSGLRTDGKLDGARLTAFFAVVRETGQ
jgi:phosphoribosylanthranilate isomerase